MSKVVILSQRFFTFQQGRVHQASIGGVKNRSVLGKLGSAMDRMVRLECDGSSVFELSSSLTRILVEDILTVSSEHRI